MKNILPIDRFIRFFLAIVLFEAAFFWLSGTLQILAYGAGAVMLVTGAISFCPIYKVLGLNFSTANANLQSSLWRSWAEASPGLPSDAARSEERDHCHVLPYRPHAKHRNFPRQQHLCIHLQDLSLLESSASELR